MTSLLTFLLLSFLPPPVLLFPSTLCSSLPPSPFAPLSLLPFCSSLPPLPVLLSPPPPVLLSPSFPVLLSNSSLSRHRLSEADEDEELMDDEDLVGSTITRFAENPWCE